jgi:DUF4097 and DUF4098 domain-containing protein YvlB
MSDPRTGARISNVWLAVIPLLGLMAAAQEKNKPFSYAVGRQAIISITNNYGPITVKPSGSRQVWVTTVSHSDAIRFVNKRHGDRIDLRVESNRQGANLADYTVLVPSDAVISLRSSDGNLAVQGLCGDVVLETITASVQVTGVRDAHLHIGTLGGPISLSDIHHSHLEVRSVSGNVDIHNVTESSMEVNSGRGRITYEGDPGPAGDYFLTSHSGDLEVSIPASAPVEIKSRTIKGEADQGLLVANDLPTIGQGNGLLKPGIVSASRFVLRSFRGKIRLKRP